MAFEHLDHLGEVGQAARQAVDLVDHHDVDLAASYAPVMNFQQPQARTALQLIDDVLTLNGIPLGWNIDWGLTNWNVPAGVFTQQGTWMEALVAIASAAGVT